MLLLVVIHGIRPAANKTVQEKIARTAKGLAGLAAIAINEANTRTVCYIPALCIALHTS
jgi:hypothetical protein